jgi:polyferredoxin
MLKNLLLALKIASLLTLGPVTFIGSLGFELKGAIWNCPFPLPFIMCNYCPIFCTFGSFRTGLFYGILGGNLFMGRMFCGLWCPGGAAQDLLFKLPVKKFTPFSSIDSKLKWLKYGIAFIVILLVLETNNLWRGLPLAEEIWLFLTQYNAEVRIGLISTIALSLLLSPFISRTWCRYICPLGGWIAPFNKYSLVGIKYTPEKCTACHSCSRRCSGGAYPLKEGWKSAECLRCLECYMGCHNHAFKFKLGR